MCSPLISTPLPPCHHFPPLCPHWGISIDSHLSVEPSPWNQLKKRFHLQIPSRDICYLAVPFREKTHSHLSRNVSNVSCHRDECNQAGHWWAKCWTHTPLLWQEEYYIWQLCHIFLKSFSLISRQKALEISLTFRYIFFCFPTFPSEKGKRPTHF